MSAMITLLRGGALLFIAALATALAAQETPPPPASDAQAAPRALRYFRVEVPLGHEDEWKKLYFGFEPHPYPIEQAEFDRLLRASNPAPRRTGDARIASLRGEAQLAGDALIGQAQLEVAQFAPIASLLSLADGNWAIAGARWSDGRAAQIGSLPDGSPVLVVAQPGTLCIDWSLRGRRESDGLLQFDLRLPHSQNAQLDLRLPGDVRIAATHGVVAEMPQSTDGQRNWSLRLGSLPRTQLSLATRPQTPAGQSAWLARQQCDYTIDEHGLRLATELSLDRLPDSAASGALKLQVDAGLHLTGATVDGQPAQWEVSSLGGVEQILLTLQPSPAAARLVKLTAIGEFPPSAARKLPAVRPVDVVWQRGAATVTIGDVYQLQDIDLTGGRLLNLSAAPAGRAANLEFFEPSGRATLACGLPEATYRAQSTYAWRIAADGIDARYFAELSAGAGFTYGISAAIAAGWEVSEQDVRVYAAAAEPSVELSQTRVRVDGRRMHIVFDDPLAAGRALRLEISARRRGIAAGQQAPASELAFVRLVGATGDWPVGLATTASPFRVQLSGSEVQRVARDELAAPAAAWIPAGDAYAAFRMSDGADGPAVAIVRDPPRVEAEVLLAVDVDRRQLAETHDIHIQPDAGGIDRLRVAFWPPRAEPITWTMTATDELPVVEFRRVEPPPSTPHDGAPEIWEVKFHQRQSSPFVLHAQRTAPLAEQGPTRVALAVVEEATAQSGRAAIRSPYGVPVTIAARRLRAVAAGRDDAAGRVVRGVFRYEPSRAMAAGDESLSVAVDSAAEQAWAGLVVVESQLMTGAAHVHRATWQIHNDGRARLRLYMPPNGQLHGVTMGGVAVEPQPQAGGEFLIELPPGVPQTELSIDYETAASPLGARGSVSTAVPQIDLPVLRRIWRAAVPEGYVATVAGSTAADTSASNEPAIGERLFGPLYRHGSPAMSDTAAIEIELPVTGEVKIHLCRSEFLWGLRLACLLIALSLAWWLPGLRTSALVGASLLAGVVALAASPSLAVAASGALLGLLLGAALRGLVRERREQPAETGNTSTATAAVQLASLMLWCFALPLAASPAAANEHRANRPYPVWIPVNEQREPSGEVYLPRAFYAELQARARAAEKTQSGWLLTSAAYDLQLAWQGSPPALVAESLVISFDLDVTAASPRATLSLPYAGPALGPEWATLDGEPIDVVWQPEQQSIELALEAPGLHRLELHLQPSTTEAHGQQQLELAIPRSLAARLQVTAPTTSPTVEVQESHGAVTEEFAALPLEQGGEERVKRWRAELGAVDRLLLSWPRHAAPVAPPLELAIEPMSWLKLAGEPRLEAKFRCTVTAGVLHELWLSAPADLKLVPTSAKWQRVATPASPTATYRLALEKPVEKETVVRAEFQLPAPAGMGRMLAPTVQLRDAASASPAMLAVSLPSGAELAPDPALRPLAVDDFVRRWGEATAAPAHVFQLDPAARPMQLALRPAAALPATRENLVVQLTKGRAKLQFTAEVAAAAIPLQLYELATPPGFAVEQASVRALADDAETPELIAWTSTDTGRLRLFLHLPASGKLQIDVAGSAPLPLGESPLPLVRIDAADCTARSIELYRDSDTLAEVVDVQGYEAPAQPEESLPGASGRRFATLIADQPSAAAATCTLAVAANHPQLAGRQVTRLLRDDDAWLVQVDWQLQVSAGLVDALRFELPAEWASQIALDPPLAHRISPAGDAARRALVVSPLRPLGGAFQLQATFRSAAPAAQVQVPDIRLRDAGELERFVVVPRAIDAQNIQWQVDRLLALVPQRRAELGFEDDDAIVYRVASDPFRAELRALRRVAGVPLVRLADVRFVWSGGASGSGRATFDLDPAGLSSATVAVPAYYKIVHVQVGDLPAQVQPISPQRWRVALWPQGLPQRLEVFYDAVLEPPPDQRTLVAQAPILEDIAVERTLWTIYSPPAAGPGLARTGGKSTALTHDLIRLRTLAEVLRLPRHLRVETTTRETSDWFTAWEARWQSLRRATSGGPLSQANGQAKRQALADLQALDADHEQFVADLDVAPSALPVAPAASPAVENWHKSMAASQSATRSRVQGASASMIVDFAEPASFGDAAPRTVLAVLLLLGGLGLLFVRFWLPENDWHLRSGRAIGVAAGFAWAVWLWPAWVGWLIAIYFLWPEQWRPWREARSEPGSAVIVREGGTV